MDPRQGFSGSDSQDKSKPETEPKNGNRFGTHCCDGRSFCGRGCETNLAVRKQQQKAKPGQTFLGVGITSSKHRILTMIANRECGEAVVKIPGVRQNEHMNTYVVNFDEGSIRVQAKNEAEALTILAEWFECSPTVLLEVI